MEPTHPMTTRAKDGIFKIKRPFVGVSQRQVNPHQEPRTVAEAFMKPHWKAAMRTEYEALVRNRTWTLEPPQDHFNIVGSKWIFKTKYNADGTVQHYKAQLVAQGFHQEPGIDFSETFSPVIKPSTVRVILTLAVTCNWQVRQLDINNAFLNGILQETVYMRQPEGFIDPQRPNLVCKLSKALYGLKQAPRAWFDRLKDVLLSWKFINSRTDTSLFYYRDAGHIIFILIYVDHILVTSNNPHSLNQFVARLNELFSLKDLGPVHYFLGVEIIRDNTGFYLTQTKYIDDLLERTEMATAKPCSTPMVAGKSLSRYEGVPFSDARLFRHTIGALQYLAQTRPDISYSVNKLSQFMSCPTDVHWQAVKRLLRYLKGTRTMGLHLKPSTSELQLIAFSDADWASCPDDRKSTGGSLVFLGDSLVSWSSKKQSAVARSSTELEYRSLAHTASELTWLLSLLHELQFSCLLPSVIWCDNMSASSLAANPVFHARTKHIEIDAHFIRDHVLAKRIAVRYVPTVDQIADGLTKPLPSARFRMLRDKLGVTISPSRLWGADRDACGLSVPCRSTLMARNSDSPIGPAEDKE